MFHRGNLNKKSIVGSNDNKQAADSWEAPKTTADIQWALLNLAEVFAQLWPYDGSVRVIQRVLIRYDWAAGYGSSEKDRCRIMEEFTDKVMCENANRAARSSPPLSFEQVKNRWRDAVEREPQARHSSNTEGSSSFRGKQDTSQPQSGRGGRGGGITGRGGFGGPRPTRGGWQAKTAVAEFQGNQVCYHFNMRPPAGKNTACNRPAAPGGCDNGRGGIYAHVCNFHTGNGVFCLQQHARHNNH